MAPDIPKIDPNQRGQTGRYTSFPRWKIGSIRRTFSSHFSVTCRTVGISAELTYNPGVCGNFAAARGVRLDVSVTPDCARITGERFLSNRYPEGADHYLHGGSFVGLPPIRIAIGWCQLVRRFNAKDPISISTLVQQAILHHQLATANVTDVFHRISLHQDKVRKFSRRD